MTIPNTARKAGPLLGTGSQTAWPFTFKVFAAGDVQVTIANSSGVETLLVLGTDYSVSLNANQETSPGGTVTYPLSGSALPVGSVLAIIGDLDYDQPLDLPSGGNFSPTALENQLDRSTMQIQQLREEMNRTAKLPPTSSESVEELVDDLQRIADSADNLDTVANNIADVNTVAADLNEPVSEINTVATSIANVNTVGTNIANVNTVAGISANVTTVAGIQANVTTVAGIAANVTAVAGNAANINAVAANETNIDAVAANATNINAVAANEANIDTVAGISAAVSAVAAIDDDVSIVAANLADVTNFADVYLGPKTSDPTLRNDGSALQAGDLYFNTVDGALRAYSGTAWVAGTAGTLSVQNFSGNGSTTAFTLSSAPAGENNTQVYIGGVYQQKDQYSVSGTTLTFSTAPVAGTNNIEVVTISTLALGETDAALVSFVQAGTGATERTVQNKLRDVVSVNDFGADPTGVANSSAAIALALASASHVVVSPGTYRCDSMIELNANKTLELKGGATLIRKSAHSASTDPVVWVKGSSASFIGAGQNACGVQTENRCPKGVVRLGHKDMTESHGNVTYCTLKDMRISGAVAYGRTTGDPDVALYMPNPQFGDLASYFHNIFGLFVANANYGIWLCGWANANTISNIQGFTLGNTTLGTNKNAFIYCNGALDNAISNVFFHNSPDSIGLLVDDYNNTGIAGGSLHQPYANSFSGMVFEQGGSAALGLKALSGGGSFYEIRHNTAGGNSLYAGFSSSNTFFGLGNNPTFDDLYVTDDLTVGDTATAAKVLVAGATDDGVSKLRVEGAARFGRASQRSYDGTGTRTVVARFGQTLTGGFWRNAVIELVFHGMTAGAANEEYARYYIPVVGLSAWAIGTPVKVYGATLTITQTASASNSVTFTVAGGSTSQVVSIYVFGTAQGGLALE